MGQYVGADWAGKGWLSVTLSDGGDEPPRPAFHASILNLWLEHREAEEILIDVPIGLPEADTRICDAQGKKLMGSRHGSVYTVPVREAAYRRTYEEAKTVQQRTARIGLSTQSWGIIPRIREVDVFLRHYDEARNLIRETHPELCFMALKGQRLVSAKSDPKGEEERREVLEAVLRENHRPGCNFLNRLRKNNSDPIVRGAVHDILDAMVAAYTATLPDEGRSILPLDGSHTDAEGLPMEIVLPRLSEALIEAHLTR